LAYGEGVSSLASTVTIVTGANTGIGRATALELARRGAHVFVACRSEEKGREAIDAIRKETSNDKVEYLALDLASLDSVRRAAEAFLARDLPLPLLINNAGVAGQQGQTADGFELHFGVNHLGHFLFTLLLEDKIKSSAPARIVNVSSGSHYQAKGIDWEAVRKPTKTITGLPEYEVSKLANVLFAKSHAKRLEGTGVTTYSLHPGVVASDAWRRIPWPIRKLMTLAMISNEEGSKTSLYCATSPDCKDESGLYYDKSRVKEPSKLAHDSALAEELWRRSEAWVGLDKNRN
jgi:retinol dehydrogenase-12